MAFTRTKHGERWLDFDGMRIRYIDIGQGEPALLIHGLGGKIEDHEAVFPHLSDRYRIIDVDQPGSGFSSKPDMEYSVDYLADFLLEFMSRLGIEKFKVIGGSQGGLLALLLCHKAPERIEKAVIYSAAGVWKPRPRLAELVRRLPPQAGRIFLHFTSFLWFSPLNPDFFKIRAWELDFIDSREMPGFGRHIRDCIASQIENDYLSLYARIKTPVLIIWGTMDLGMPISQGRILNRILPDSRLIEAPGAGHNVDAERPEFFAAEVKKFFG